MAVCFCWFANRRWVVRLQFQGISNTAPILYGAERMGRQAFRADEFGSSVVGSVADQAFLAVRHQAHEVPFRGEYVRPVVPSSFQRDVEGKGHAL